MAVFPLSSIKTPGVYVQEIRKLPPSVAQVDTAVPVFIGFTETAERNGESLVNEPTRITSLDQYTRWYGNPYNESFSVDIVGTADEPVISAPRYLEIDFRMFYAVQMFFSNGGGECYILSVGVYGEGETGAVTSVNTALLFTEDIKSKLRKEPEPTLIVLPDLVNKSTGTVDTGYPGIYAGALDFCAERDINNYFVIMDVAQDTANAESPLDDAETFRNNLSRSIDALQYGAAYYPYVVTSLPPAFNPADITVTDFTEDQTGDTLPMNTPTMLADLQATDNQLYNQILDAINRQTRLVLPPSGAMAGAYASVDSTRGVFKAPANIGLANVLGPMVKVSDKDHDDFNVDTTGGKSINVIRTFIGRGTLVWGARTLAGNDREWRYVSVRRFFNMVEESVKRALTRFVFEPNNRNTWISMRGTIETFLETQWRGGALLGDTPDDAYFVRIGMPETFTEAEMLDGFAIAEIGMAVVRPAEFIVLKFMHKFELGGN